jgi:hypothetical protein
MSLNSEYIPGVCNIGPPEITKRKQAAWIGLAFTIGLWIVFAILRVPSEWKLLLFLPATMSAIGFLQARMKFCVAFGMIGVFNFSLKVGKTDTVDQAEYRRKDKQKALQLIIYSVLIGIVVAVVGYLL